MMDHWNESKIGKLENPKRLEELDPRNTLIKAGFQDGMSLCDIGAGSGIFSFPAAEFSSGDIYALDISDSMVALLKRRKEENNARNLIVRKVEGETLPVDSGVCDFTIMVTVFHEIDYKEAMLQEIKRILREKGRLLIIEFHDIDTPMGPPADHRISEEYVEDLCTKSKFKTIEKFKLGDNLYGIVFES